MSNLELSESIHNKTLEEISYEIIQLLMSLVLGFFKEVAHFIVCRIHALTLTGNFVRVFLCGHFIPLSQVFLNIRYLYIAMVSEDRSSIDRPTLYYCFWIPGFPGPKYRTQNTRCPLILRNFSLHLHGGYILCWNGEDNCFDVILISTASQPDIFQINFNVWQSWPKCLV